MKKIKVEDALGKALLHDLTGTKDSSHKKTTIFKKDHIITKEDIDILKNSGKYHIYIKEDSDKLVHENEVALEFAKEVVSDKLTFDKVNEGKINILANTKGILKVDRDKINILNKSFDITLATRKNYDLINKGDIIASFRIIDLFWQRDLYDKFISLVDDSLFEIVDVYKKKIKLITIGTEIYEKRVEDLSYIKLDKKLSDLDNKIDSQVFLKDDLNLIEKEIVSSSTKYDIIYCTGGMSVDADDFTKLAILNVSDKIICDHTPYLPGSMFTITKLNNSIILGCPANVVFNEFTVLDLFITRIILDELPTTDEIMELGYGALKN